METIETETPDHADDAVPPPLPPGFAHALARRMDSAGLTAVQQRFGTEPLHMKRDLDNWLKALRADKAVQSGIPRQEAFRRAGLSRAAAYRALRRQRSG